MLIVNIYENIYIKKKYEQMKAVDKCRVIQNYLKFFNIYILLSY